MFYVYVLRSESTGKRYVGQTDNLARRLNEHNTLLHNPLKFTSKQAGPWLLVHFEVFASRAEAMARERWLKTGRGRAWLDAQLGRAGPPLAD
jgi:putative endonuclease